MRFVLGLVIPSTLALATFACGGDQNPGGSSSTTGGAGGSGGSAGGGAGGTPDPGPIDVPDVSRSASSFEESEPHVAASSDGRVAVAWIGIQQTGMSDIGYAFSSDGGATFGEPLRAQMPAGMLATDPVMATDEAGSIYLTWLGFKATSSYPSDMHLYVAKSGPGATSFDAPAVAHAPGAAFYDKPWIAVTQKGTVVVSHTESDGASYSRVVAARSSDGVTWTNTTLPGKSVRSLAYLCASRTTPRIHAVWIGQAMTFQVLSQWSDDEGETWSPEVAVSGGDLVGFDGPACVAEGDDVWVTYSVGAGQPTASSFQKLTSLRVAHSTDGGVTYKQRADAHDPAAGTYFLHPALALGGSGALEILYYAGAKANDPAGAIRSARSADQGSTFAPSAVDRSPLIFDLSREDTAWLGDYMGVAVRGGHRHLAYVDNSGKVSHVGYRRVALP